MIKYRKATINEIEDLLKVRLDFLNNAKNTRNEEDKRILLISNREFLSTVLADGSFIQWLALDGDKIIATSSVSVYLLPPNVMRPTGKVAYIGNMFTYPKYRKQGIATKLFALSVNEAKQAGCKEILLDATEMGRSIYQKYGFKKSEEAMSYYIV
jgi:GNAT superfamily N-acetyltransferase